MAGIKETQELINLIKVAGETYKAAKADGSIDYKDLTKLGPAITALRAAVAGADQVKLELKDLDSAELQTVLEDLIAAIGVVVDAVVG